jgi:L-threonylcarbamoyladenylate synthase
MPRVRVDPLSPDPGVLEAAARVIDAGGVVALPTDTLYGLAADPFCSEAVERVFHIKGRAAERALPLIAADRAQVIKWVGPLPALGDPLADAFWPGPLTLLVPAPPTLADAVSGGTGLVGVRVPAHAVARGLCRACDRPLTATSANVSGRPAPADAADVERQLGHHVDLLLDGGPAPGGEASTIVDVTGPAARLVRSGALEWERVIECMNRRR